MNDKVKNFLDFYIELGIEFSCQIVNSLKTKFNTKEKHTENFDQSSKLDTILKKALVDKSNNQIFSNGKISSDILIVSDDLDEEAKKERIPFTGKNFKMLENMFGAIDIDIKDIAIICIDLTNNLNDYKILINNIPYCFEEILSRYIKIIKPSYLINMSIIYKNINVDNVLLSAKPKMFHISNPKLILEDHKLKRDAWEKLKSLRENLDEKI